MRAGIKDSVENSIKVPGSTQVLFQFQLDFNHFPGFFLSVIQWQDPENELLYLQITLDKGSHTHTEHFSVSCENPAFNIEIILHFHNVCTGKSTIPVAAIR
jgi:hypothetical protein